MVDLLRQGDDRDLHTFGLFAIAERLQGLGETARSRPLYEEALAVASANDWFAARERYMRGRLAAIADDPVGAEELFLESVDIAEQHGDRFGAMLVLSQTGEVAATRGDLDRARDVWQRGRDLAAALGLRGAVASFDIRLATITLTVGDYEGAAARLRDILEEGRAVAIPSVMGHACAGLALVARLHGDLDTAEACARESLDIFRNAGMPAGTALGWIVLGFVAEARGNVDLATECFTTSLADAQVSGHASYVARSIEGFAAVALRRGEPERAAALLGHAATFRAATGTSPVGPDRDDLERITAGTQAELAPEAFATAFEGGSRAELSALTP